MAATESTEQAAPADGSGGGIRAPHAPVATTRKKQGMPLYLLQHAERMAKCRLQQGYHWIVHG
jgi:hypothetical protein